MYDLPYESIDLFVLCRVTFVNCILKAFTLSMSVMAVVVPKRMLLICCVGGFLLDCFAMVHHRRCGCVFVINFVEILFSDLCFVFVYLFIYVIVKSNDFWV